MKNKGKEEWKFSFKKILIASILICCLPRMNLVYSRFFKSKRGTYQDIMYTKPKKFWEVNLEKRGLKMDIKYVNRPLDIAIDFDGTITKENSYPEIGELKVNCVDVLKKLKAQGHRLILWTCRNGQKLDEAIQFMAAQGIEFDSVNKSIWNPGTLSVKVCAHLYIDDAAYPFTAKDPNFWTTLGKEFGLEGYTN